MNIKVKYLTIGLTVGLLFSFSTQIYAGIDSLVGKKVQSEASVFINGVKKDTAIIIDGKSYAPVRSIGESAGFKVSSDKGGIKLETSENTNSGATGTVEVPKVSFKYTTVEEYDDHIAQLKKGIADYETKIELYNKQVETVKADPETYNRNDAEFLQSIINDFIGYKAEFEKQLSILEKERAAFIASKSK